MSTSALSNAELTEAVHGLHDQAESHSKKLDSQIELLRRLSAVLEPNGTAAQTAPSMRPVAQAKRVIPVRTREQILADEEMLLAAQRQFFADKAVEYGLAEMPRKPLSGLAIAGIAVGTCVAGGAIGYGITAYIQHRSGKGSAETV